MKRALFGSAAAILAVVGFSAFKAHVAANRVGTIWLPATENNTTLHTGSISKLSSSKTLLSSYDAADPQSSEPVQGTAVGDCITNSALICAAQFNTDGSGNPTGTAKAFDTGSFQYPS